MDGANRLSTHKLVQCRICHDEDEDSNMEPPCSCRGSLKYAHRKCVQRWCNEKGDTICEICQQQFKPGYTAPPPLFHYGNSPLNFRGNWEISRRDLQNHQFIDMFAAANRELSDTDEEYSVPSTGSLVCFRIVAIIFIALLVLRHTLPIILSGGGEYSLTIYMFLFMRTIAVLLPVCIMVKVFTIIQRRRFQDQYSSILQHEESELEQPQSRVIHIL
ncbi:uncharacterized protein LOC114752776 [Neltuma alba]|uniref:uncharacterized protein LOC114752776 n=1 Tax=Neltuma alba TaxID=207710 RepID=UPI0010A4CBAF|nr:uncharacterized protein LOC114752776 [Prosopis alba]XP_028797310.1 uncharacterized protein LOC114752776 [Prosopis alba]XP_028797311.1 uncharacterized protein LOC114752776 [Prosopis alba]XP_028797312.1 uncharacterized protein LOC114752776 [Prosopis alba]XP_028797313.1 uncharacterized protein LOC114752776 [Prosopis alba]XP_028797314.1 uncharacterized protein LOC114752776 [Prosopis alba]XP_028797315.1 uncharacterized protein LOC114752776 [Prosopis alba]